MKNLTLLSVFVLLPSYQALASDTLEDVEAAMNRDMARYTSQSSPSLGRRPSLSEHYEDLQSSSVAVLCGGAFSTGIAVGERHILTSVHSVAAHFLERKSVSCIVFDPSQPQCAIPAVKTGYRTSEGEDTYEADITGPAVEALSISRVYFPDSTTCAYAVERPIGINMNPVGKAFHSLRDEVPECVTKSLREDEVVPVEITLDSLPREIAEHCSYGLEDGRSLVSQGVGVYIPSQQANRVEGSAFIRVLGPDVAILETSAPHGLLPVEIADPLDTEVPLHIVGVSGFRYTDDSLRKPCAGAFPTLFQRKLTYVLQPTVYRQPFRCLPAYEDGTRIWINRVPLQVVNGGRGAGVEFLMDSDRYIGARKGFGLIVPGDSGAGAVTFIGEYPYLAGIASQGSVDPLFESVQNLLSAPSLRDHPELAELRRIYEEALRTQDDSKKWCNLQALVDVTHMKDWILGIVGEGGAQESGGKVEG